MDELDGCQEDGSRRVCDDVGGLSIVVLVGLDGRLGDRSREGIRDVKDTGGLGLNFDVAWGWVSSWPSTATDGAAT